jgi:Domain of unknown function (DUF1772)
VRHQWSELGLSGIFRSVGYVIYWECLLIVSAPSSSLARTLYAIAAVSTASGVPYALTFLRRTNGALSIRSEKLAGQGNGALALTYAFNEKRSIDREKAWSTKELVLRWKWHNEVRTAILTLGTMLGAWGIGIDK